MSLLRQAPRFDRGAAARIARDLYGLDASASPLPSERDQNFEVAAADGARYVLKISNASEPRALLEAQNAALAHVAPRVPFCARVVPTLDGGAIGVAPGGCLVRLVTYLEGVPLAEAGPPSAALVGDIGRSMGRLDAALADFDHPAIHRDFYWDLAHARRGVDDYLPLVDDADLRRLVERVSGGALAWVDERATSLRRSAVHHDANDWNLLVRGECVSGVLDFGDMVHSWTVADPAVALAYVWLAGGDPLAAAASLVRGYDDEYPLEAAEIDVVVPLAQLRLCMSVCIAASQRRERPDDEYLTVSQAPIRRALPALGAIDLSKAAQALHLACGVQDLRRG